MQRVEELGRVEIVEIEWRLLHRLCLEGETRGFFFKGQTSLK